jgi:hypothetical protein
VVNSILWGNTAASGKEIAICDSIHGSSTVTISFSDVDGGKSAVYIDTNCGLYWNAGMIDADPLFVQPGIGDLHLTWNSPCRDSGDNSAATELFDFEGDPRIFMQSGTLALETLSAFGPWGLRRLPSPLLSVQG